MHLVATWDPELNEWNPGSGPETGVSTLTSSVEAWSCFKTRHCIEWTNIVITVLLLDIIVDLSCS